MKPLTEEQKQGLIEFEKQRAELCAKVLSSYKSKQLAEEEKRKQPRVKKK